MKTDTCRTVIGVAFLAIGTYCLFHSHENWGGLLLLVAVGQSIYIGDR